MLIYYLCAISGRDRYESYYRRTVAKLRELGHEVLDDHVLGVSPKQARGFSVEKRKKYYKEMIGRLRRADLVVADVTHPTINLGYELGLASLMSVPVLVLYQGDNVPCLLLGIDDPRFEVCEYSNQDLESVIETETASLLDERDVRFNFFISPQLSSYLDWLSKTERLPRATFLRTMLEKKMEYDEEYQGMLRKSN